MKAILLSLSLIAALSSCSSKGSAPAPSDPFLGHWEAPNYRSVVYSSAGGIVTDQTTTQVTKLDITATTMTFTGVTAGGAPTTEVDPYTRNGELITYTSSTGKETVYARSLTATTFTLEFNGPKVAGKTYYIQSMPFKR